jgi:2-polyprenyl-3-methyl-5-hydroxy-6-metoxy-1,4-benzoquinol methylase
MKSYYDAHEIAYQQIKARGGVGWDNAKTIEELGDIKTMNYLKSSISKYFPLISDMKALDLGCGSGTTAFTLAQLGFLVTGIDISETAIELARELTLKQNLQIQFQIGDVLSLEKLNQKFDLIYDSHCFHCIVFDEDRRRVLDGVKKSLSDNGIFILDTMAMTENYDPTDKLESLRFDNDHILWHKTKPSTDRGVVAVNGQHWCAQRRIYPSDKILEEVAKAGFVVISEVIDSQNVGETKMLRLILRN